MNHKDGDWKSLRNCHLECLSKLVSKVNVHEFPSRYLPSFSFPHAHVNSFSHLDE